MSGPRGHLDLLFDPAFRMVPLARGGAWCRLALVSALVAFASAGVAASQTEPAPGDDLWHRMHWGGFLDVDYAWNGEQPSDHANFTPGVGVAAKRANEMALDFAVLEAYLDPTPAAPIGFHLTAAAGNGIDVLHAGEPEGESVGRTTFRQIYTAEVSYLAPVGRGLKLEAGIFPSHIGYESGLTRDNWNYTPSWAASLSPYYQTGIKASYAWNDHWSAELHVLNGWQIIGENNDGKSVGTKVAWTNGTATVALNTWIGPELPNDNHDLRTLFDLVAQMQATPRWSVGFEGYRGHEHEPVGESASWSTLVGYARFQATPKSAVSARLEWFDDPRGAISGTAQTLHAATLTLEHRPRPALALKLEGRVDHSSAAIFKTNSERMTSQQTLIVGAAILTF